MYKYVYIKSDPTPSSEVIGYILEDPRTDYICVKPISSNWFGEWLPWNFGVQDLVFYIPDLNEIKYYDNEEEFFKEYMEYIL